MSSKATQVEQALCRHPQFEPSYGLIFDRARCTTCGRTVTASHIFIVWRVLRWFKKRQR